MCLHAPITRSTLLVAKQHNAAQVASVMERDCSRHEAGHCHIRELLQFVHRGFCARPALVGLWKSLSGPNRLRITTKLPCALPAFGQPALKYITDPKAVAGPKGPGAQRVLSCRRSAFEWASLCHNVARPRLPCSRR